MNERTESTHEYSMDPDATGIRINWDAAKRKEQPKDIKSFIKDRDA